MDTCIRRGVTVTLVLLSIGLSPIWLLSTCEEAAADEAQVLLVDYHFRFTRYDGHMDFAASEIIIDSSMTSSFTIRVYEGEYDESRHSYVYPVHLLDWTNVAQGDYFRRALTHQQETINGITEAMRKGLCFGSLLVDNEGRIQVETTDATALYPDAVQEYIHAFGRNWAAPSPGIDLPYQEGREFIGKESEGWKGWFGWPESVKCTQVKVWKDGRTEVVLNSSRVKPPVSVVVDSGEKGVTIPQDEREWVLKGHPLMLHSARAYDCGLDVRANRFTADEAIVLRIAESPSGE